MEWEDVTSMEDIEQPCIVDSLILCLPNSQILGYKSMAYSIHIFL